MESEPQVIKKKICMLGAFGVGKTSLVRNFVHSKFDESYLSTIGVKIDRKTVGIDDRQVDLMLWDIAGEEEFFQIPMDYVRGAAGYFLVCDGTRPETFETAITVKGRVDREVGEMPLVGLINKNDLASTAEWQATDEAYARFSDQGWPVMQTSAKTGENVEAVFLKLAKQIIKP